MDSRAKAWWNLWCLLVNLPRYSIIFLLSVVLVFDSAGAIPPTRGLLNGQQPGTTQRNAFRAAAEQAFKEGLQLYKLGTAESLRKAILKWFEALQLWQQLNDQPKQALTLTGIGKVYSDLGEKQKALEYFNQALPLSRAVGDRSQEAVTLGSIGKVYSDLGEKQKALEYFNQALPLLHAVGDRSQEATILNNIGKVYSDLGEKQRALAYLNQALPLHHAVGNKSGEAFTLNNIGAVYNDLGEKQKALAYLNQALPLHRAVGDKSGEALTLNNIGAVYNDLGEKQKALAYYNQALSLRRAVGNKSGEALTLNNIGVVYDSLGEKQKALEYYNQALPLERAVSDKFGEATILNNIGKVYNDLGEKQKALEYYNQVLPLERAVGDKSGEALTLNNIGAVYDSLGEKQKALAYFNQALPLHRAVGDKSQEATTLNNIGKVYDDLGEKQKAFEYYNQVLPLERAVGDKSKEAVTLNNIGKVYNDLGEKQKSLAYFNQALPLRRAVGDKSGEAGTLNNIGGVYDDLGEKQKALAYYNQALPLHRLVGDKSQEATTLNNIGKVYSDLGEKQKALEYYNQALPLERAVGDKSKKAVTLNNIGLVYSDLGEKQKALEYYNQALPLHRAVGDKSREALTLSNIALVERDIGNLQPALTQIQAAINIIEDLRTKIASQELRTSYFASVQGDYQFYIDLLMRLHKKDSSHGYDALALHINERSRARVLLELLTEAKAGIRKDVDPKLLAESQRLLELIDAKEKARFEIVNSPKNGSAMAQANADQLATEVSALLSQQKELETQIRTSSPKYAALKYPQPLSLPQIQQQLDKDTLLLEYSLGKEHSYLWAVTQTSMTSYQLPKREEIEAATKDFYQLLKNPGNSLYTRGGIQVEPGSASGTANVNVNKLSQMLLQPVASQLGNKRLLIVGDGALQFIPFAALPDITKQTQPLLVNHEIINFPSATTIALQRQELTGRKVAPLTLAILADPVFSADDMRVTANQGSIALDQDIPGQLEQSALKRVARNLNRNGWQRLDGTRNEAQAISQLVPASNRLEVYDFDANYNWANSPQLQQYRYLHFATHGFADSTNPELSGIVLSLVDKQGQPIRGYLRLGDIFNLNLPAELLVLSACETGLGKEVNGEGLVGLTRGLMYAGAARLVVSLWEVDDRGTSMLMQEFYKQLLQQGKSPVTALRAAQLNMWQQQQWHNPYYWSAFTFQGEWR